MGTLHTKIAFTNRVKSIFLFSENPASHTSLRNTYRKIASSNTSRLEAHVGFFRMLMKGTFGPYVLWPFDKKLYFLLSNAH